MSAPEGPLLLCYDGSEDARHAIESVGSLFATRRALVLSVWQPIGDVGILPGFGETASMADFVELDREAAEAGGRVAAEGVRIAEASGLEAEPLAVKGTGPVWRTILEVADTHDAAAIVMGSRGRSGVRSLLLGSVSNAVIHHAGRPTLVVRPSSDEEVSKP
jgi:nucleotide-binding universal stress UspA family protein